MRLRPSGRQGPVATALASFERYQMEEAWTWEHMALTRARVLAGEPSSPPISSGVAVP
jgi:glutamate-ammonia-ligase adenylyltransferase